MIDAVGRDVPEGLFATPRTGCSWRQLPTIHIVRKPADQQGFAVIPRRRAVERTFGWLTAHRRLARDLLGVAVLFGAAPGEVAQVGELGLDPVQPGA